ncbi:hypothetical protein BGZ46_006054, partial [Entomortierella lignicola]
MANRNRNVEYVEDEDDFHDENYVHENNYDENNYDEDYIDKNHNDGNYTDANYDDENYNDENYTVEMPMDEHELLSEEEEGYRSDNSYDGPSARRSSTLLTRRSQHMFRDDMSHTGVPSPAQGKLGRRLHDILKPPIDQAVMTAESSSRTMITTP